MDLGTIILSYAPYFPTAQRNSGTQRMRGWGKYEIVLQRRYLRLQKSICTSTHLLDSLGIIKIKIATFLCPCRLQFVIGANILATF